MSSSFKILSTPAFAIDNTILPIVPNSLKFNEGLGEIDVRTQSAGGGSVSMVHSFNAETAFSTIAVQVENTQENVEFLRSIKSSQDPHVITFFDSRVGFTRTMSQAFITNNYDVGLGADTPIDLEIKGAAVV